MRSKAGNITSPAPLSTSGGERADERRETRGEAHTLVLALGNPLRGDDGIGTAVLAALREADLPEGVALVDGGTAGLESILLMQGYQRAIVVDAAQMGLEAGAWRRFDLREVTLQAGDLSQMGTLHAAGLSEALALGEALGVLPPQIVIFGVQPQEVGWEAGLSASVQAALPALVAAIRDELHRGCARDGENTDH